MQTIPRVQFKQQNKDYTDYYLFWQGVEYTYRIRNGKWSILKDDEVLLDNMTDLLGTAAEFVVNTDRWKNTYLEMNCRVFVERILECYEYTDKYEKYRYNTRTKALYKCLYKSNGNITDSVFICNNFEDYFENYNTPTEAEWEAFKLEFNL